MAKHLGQLVEAGLVRIERPSGRRRPYRLDPAPTRAAQVWLAVPAHGWDERLSGLVRHLDAESGT